MDQLTPELTWEVLACLPAPSLALAGASCRAWHAHTAGREGLLWRRHLARLWGADHHRLVQRHSQRGAAPWPALIRLTHPMPISLDPAPPGGPCEDLVLLSAHRCVYTGPVETLGGDRVVRARTRFPGWRCGMAHTAARWQRNEVEVGVSCVAYFEIRILPEGADGQARSWTPPEMVSIGLVDRHFPSVDHQPGWIPGSFGYHGDDGHIFNGENGMTGDVYGPTYGCGDTIGAGIDFRRGLVFFTKNGDWLGPAYQTDARAMLSHLHPAAGLDTFSVAWGVRAGQIRLRRQVIEFNFGRSAFAFDIASYEADALMCPPEPIPWPQPGGTDGCR